MIVSSLRIGPEKNFCYLIMCSDTGKTALIDPSFDFQRIKDWVDETATKNQVKACEVTYFLATHGHWDHAGGFGEMHQIYPKALVVAHASEKARLQELDVNLDVPLSDGEVFYLGGVPIQAIHTPGHTVGGCCYLTGNQLFSGDTLFIGQCGRTDLSGGSDSDLFLSLQKLKALDPTLTVRPGHDYGRTPFATLAAEIQTNPTLKAASLKEFVALP